MTNRFPPYSRVLFCQKNGTSSGVFSLYFAKHGKEVVAFEPFPNNCKELLDSVRSNGLDNVKLCEIAIGDHNGTLPLFFPDYADNETSTTGLASLGEVDTLTDVRYMDVPIVTLDHAIEQNELPPPNAIKIDIEGAEYMALLGMKKTLKQYRPDLFIEMHPAQIEAIRGSEHELYGMLKQYGYEYKIIKGCSRFSSGGGTKIHAWHTSDLEE